MTPPVLADVSVVIPTVGRPTLGRALRSLAAGTCWPAEVILSQQGTAPEVRSSVDEIRAAGLTVTHVRFAEVGTAAATNRGLERVTTPLVAVTHDDCVVEADWIERMATALRGGDDVVVTGRVDPGPGAPVPSFITDREPRTYHRPEVAGDRLYPANMGFPRSVLRRVGPFDEDLRLRHAEDNEWSYRVLSAGIPIRYEPEVAVCHLAWRQVEQRATTYRDYARSQGAFYGKYLRRGDPFMVLRTAVDGVRGPVGFVLGTVRRDDELLLASRAAIRGFVPGVIAGFRRPKRPVPAGAPSHAPPADAQP